MTERCGQTVELNGYRHTCVEPAGHTWDHRSELPLRGDSRVVSTSWTHEAGLIHEIAGAQS